MKDSQNFKNFAMVGGLSSISNEFLNKYRQVNNESASKMLELSSKGKLGNEPAKMKLERMTSPMDIAYSFRAAQTQNSIST